MLSTQEIAQGLGELLVTPPKGDAPAAFRRVVVDSRQVCAGDLFVALRGARHDGHDFITEAVRQGAAGIMVEARRDAAGGMVEHLPAAQPAELAVFQVQECLPALHRLALHRRQQQPLLVVGVTGSIGKTTCKDLIAAVLGKRWLTLKNEGNLNTEIGLPLTLFELTPQHRAAVLEMGMFAAGDIALLCEIARPQVGVITNIGPVHLERLGSLDAIASAKAELIEALPPAPEGLAILNADDPAVRGLALRTRARILWYGTAADSDVRGSDIQSHGLAGFSFRLHYRGESIEAGSPLPGCHNLHNLLAAAATGLSQGMPLAEITEALSTARPQSRLRIARGLNGSTIIDDSYNASPASVVAALDLLSEMPGRRLALLGDMRELGAAEAEGHRSVGQKAATACHQLFVIGEKGPLIAAAAAEAGLTAIRPFATREEAIAAIRQELRKGDHLLVKASRALSLEKVAQALEE